MSELLLTMWNVVFIPLWVWTILKDDWKCEILVKNMDCVKLVMPTPRWSGGFWVLCPLSAHFPWSTHSFLHTLLFMLHLKAGVSLFIIHVFFRTWRHLLTNRWCTQREIIDCLPNGRSCVHFTFVCIYSFRNLNDDSLRSHSETSGYSAAWGLHEGSIYSEIHSDET